MSERAKECRLCRHCWEPLPGSRLATSCSLHHRPRYYSTVFIFDHYGKRVGVARQAGYRRCCSDFEAKEE